jgi:hypothetical protein
MEPDATTKGKTHSLRIVFECLCAFVVRPYEVLAILPDARNGCPPMPGDGEEMAMPMPGKGGDGMAMPMPHKTASVMPPHAAAIQFDPAELSPESEVQPDLRFRRPGGRSDQAVVFLQGEDIELDPASAAPPTLVAGRAHGTPVPGSAAEAADFSWVVEVGKLDPGAGVIDPACVNFGSNASLTGKSEDPGRVVARMRLKGGTLGSVVLGLDAGHNPIPFVFTDAEGATQKEGVAQALASAVAFDVAVPQEDVALVLTPFGGKPRRLELSFAGLPMGHTIQVLIRNMPLDSLLELVETIRPGEPIYVDQHFEMYYALSATPPARYWIPSATRARSNGPICPMSQFRG